MVNLGIRSRSEARRRSKHAVVPSPFDDLMVEGNKLGAYFRSGPRCVRGQMLWKSTMAMVFTGHEQPFHGAS